MGVGPVAEPTASKLRRLGNLMFGLIVLLLIVVPIVELYVLFQVADQFGWLVSIASLLAISFLGASLMRWQTTGAWTRVTDKLRAGKVPSAELIDGGLMIFGGALLLTPGFFTDAVGLAMFIPPTRAIARRLVTKRMGKRMTVMTAGMAGGQAGPSGPGGLGGPGIGGFTFGTGNPFGQSSPGGSANQTSRGGRNPFGQPGNDVIDVDHVHVERIDPDELPQPPSDQ